jgi:hypothetical protein
MYSTVPIALLRCSQCNLNGRSRHSVFGATTVSRRPGGWGVLAEEVAKVQYLQIEPSYYQHRLAGILSKLWFVTANLAVSAWLTKHSLYVFECGVHLTRPPLQSTGDCIALNIN